MLLLVNLAYGLFLILSFVRGTAGRLFDANAFPLLSYEALSAEHSR